MEDTIMEIRACWRQRVFAMEQRKRNDNALGAYLRREFGYRNPDHALSADDEASARKIIVAANDVAAERAAACIKQGLAEAAGKPFEMTDDYAAYRTVVVGVIASREPFAELESAIDKKLVKLAKSLPVWSEFAEGVRGCGPGSLAAIVGEAGDLGNYANPAKLWKRMGLAVMDGQRQGNPGANATAADWVRHGYNKKRRSVMWNIGSNGFVKATCGTYREIYDARKAYLVARAEANGTPVKPSAEIKVKDKDKFISAGHVHRDAQRYAEKAFLKDLWQAWRRTVSRMEPIRELSAAEIQAAA